MQGVWRELAGLVLPVACAGCGRPRTELCGRCRRALGRDGRGARRVRPRPAPPGLPGVWAGAPYADEVRAVLLAHKERGALRLAGPLGWVLAGAVRGLWRGGEPLVLVPVPSARRSVAGRGHDPVRRIALAAARELRRPALAAAAAAPTAAAATGTGVGEGAGAPPRAHVLPALHQLRPVADQAGLSAPERLANLAGALGVRRGAERLLSGQPVVLVDDLVTTGATLAEAARAVTGAGGRVIGAAVVAAPTSSFEHATGHSAAADHSVATGHSAATGHSVATNHSTATGHSFATGRSPSTGAPGTADSAPGTADSAPGTAGNGPSTDDSGPRTPRRRDGTPASRSGIAEIYHGVAGRRRNSTGK
ncbi:hypothetical protein HEK616_03740 [Streptomyces nigrescens]|uniref:Phosphoribosyltransferase domain-containing protein n=1 Tax=Streptomyces nigrescens TaxID=1920 RepID=A0ABN6QL03_STRNI|nr:hypothetical protein HEK616_03740 [Streptomyces nigrescens]